MWVSYYVDGEAEIRTETLLEFKGRFARPLPDHQKGFVTALMKGGVIAVPRPDKPMIWVWEAQQIRFTEIQPDGEPEAEIIYVVHEEREARRMHRDVRVLPEPAYIDSFIRPRIARVVAQKKAA